MKFSIGDGPEYEFDETTLLVSEARLIKAHAGMGLKAFGEALEGGDPDALAAMLLIARRRAGEAVRWEDLGSVDLGKLNVVDENTEGESEDPTEPTQTGPELTPE